jgi:phage terminase small subunit
MAKKEKKLSNKEKAFAHEYIKDWCGTQAAIRAGYSKRSAKEQASRMLTKANIQNYISDIQENIAKEAGISMLSMVLELKKMAFGNIASLHQTWIKRVEFEKLTDDQKNCISEIATKTKTYLDKQGNETEEEYIKVKIHDKIKAIQEINKMLGYHSPEKMDLTTKGDKINNTMTLEIVDMSKKDKVENK